MDIRDVRAEKANLEREILYFIQDKIEEFQKKAKVLVDDLKLEMTPVEEPGSTRKEVTSVRAIILL